MNKFVGVRFREFNGMREHEDGDEQRYMFQVEPSKIETGGWSRALLVPKVDESEVHAGHMTYKKLMVECLIEALSDFEVSMRPNLRRLDGEEASAVPGVTEHALHEDLLLQFKRIVQTLSYMVHSYSWQSAGPYQDFDRAEINKRLEWAKVWGSDPVGSDQS